MAIGLISRKAKEINRVVMIPLAEIARNPSQPRRQFNDSGIRELAESIRENGLLQPVTLRRCDQGSYELIAGERRALAYRLLGRDKIPAIIEQFSEQQSAALALIENLQRENLNYFEQALAIARLMREHSLTQQQISTKLGLAQSTVANKLRLLQYCEKAQTAFLQHSLTERHARAILRVEDARMQLEAIEYVASRGLNVEQTECYVEELLNDTPAKPKPSRLFIVKDMRIFLNTINRAVDTMQKSGIAAVADKQETDDFFEYTIKIPKVAVQRRR